jgi:hypothetical protein
MAILMSLEYGSTCNTVVLKDVHIKKQLLEAFPDDAKTADSRGWLPLHWAVILSSGWCPSIPGLSYEGCDDDGIVKFVYEADPSTLERHHLKSSGDDSDALVGYTPLHFMCLEDCPDSTLISYLALKAPESFAVIASPVHIRRHAKLFTGQSNSTESTGSCLHLVAKRNEYDENVLSIIIKAVPKLVMTKGYGYDTPLPGLCGRYDRTFYNSTFYCMFNSLLEANFSREVMESPPVVMLLKHGTFVFHLLECCFKSI